MSATAQYKALALAVSPDTMKPDKAIKTTVKKMKRKALIVFAHIARELILRSENAIRGRIIYMMKRVCAPKLSIREIKLRISNLLSTMRRISQ